MKRLLNYAATHPNVKTRFYASNIRLHIDSDAEYLYEPKAKSSIAGYNYLNPINRIQLLLNHPVTVECILLNYVVSLVIEAKEGGIFQNAKTGIEIRRLLEHLGHPQPPAPIKTDNTPATAFVTHNIQQKRSNSWDMRFIG